MATKPELPQEMKAAIVNHFGPPDVVHSTHVRVPKLGRKEILIRVEIAAVGEWDPALIEGSFEDTRRKLPTIFGSEGAGVVEAAGPAVTRFVPGDRVYGWGWANKKGGFFAEYIAVKEKNCMKIPPGLSTKEAAALTISGITALQGLDQLGLEPGDNLIITGASGGVGHVAVQLAKRLGLRVFAACSGSDGVELVRQLGADVAVEGHRGRVDDDAHAFAPDGYEGALVFAGGDGWQQLMALVNPERTIAWPNGVEPAPYVPTGVRGKAYNGEPTLRDFDRLNELISQGPFRVAVTREYPLDDVADAVRDVQRHHVGKLEVRVHWSLSRSHSWGGGRAVGAAPSPVSIKSASAWAAPEWALPPHAGAARARAFESPRPVESRRARCTRLVVPMTALPPKQTTEGWRRGKPEEDPEKMKRWGWMSAKPSEFLICMRGGKVVMSGQGATLFKWPWESVCIVPTTVQRLHFVADQVTAEKAGVQVTGVAVYRIAEPLIAFRMLNFSYPERAQEKLSAMMGEMFIGATRRLVANLSVEHCMTRRKDALASELMREIAPVVGGIGGLQDRTQRGWGVVVDSIEIQDVRVMSAACSRTCRRASARSSSARPAKPSSRASALCARTRRPPSDRSSWRAFTPPPRFGARSRPPRRPRGSRSSPRTPASKRPASRPSARASRRSWTRSASCTCGRSRPRPRCSCRSRRRPTVRGCSSSPPTPRRTLRATRCGWRPRHRPSRILAAQGRVAEGRRSLAELELKIVELETAKQQLGQKLELDRAGGCADIDNTLTPEVIQLPVANSCPSSPQPSSRRWARCT